MHRLHARTAHMRGTVEAVRLPWPGAPGLPGARRWRGRVHARPGARACDFDEKDHIARDTSATAGCCSSRAVLGARGYACEARQ